MAPHAPNVTGENNGQSAVDPKHHQQADLA